MQVVDFSDSIALIRSEIVDIIAKLTPESSQDISHIANNVTLTIAPEHVRNNYQLSTNIAMICANHLGQKIDEVSESISKLLILKTWIKSLDVSCKGFINMYIDADFWHKSLINMLSLGSRYGFSDYGKQEPVNIEYASANPTGPLHIGHVRGAVYGDIMANVLQKNGFSIVREYYINDSGAQIEKVVRSALFRYKQALKEDYSNIVPDDCYPGEYMIDIGRNLLHKYGNTLDNMQDDQACQTIRLTVIEVILDSIKTDLNRIGVKHDIFVSEAKILQGNDLTEVLNILRTQNLIYYGTLPAPKGKKASEESFSMYELFRSTAYGDDIDRPLKKADGTPAYFAPDIAYHYNKYKRGFSKMILVLGADHKGYAKRIQAAVRAMSHESASVCVKLCELVNFIKSGALLKMSKRSGNFLTINDILKEVDVSVVRFMMMMRKNDTVLNFDLQKVKEQSRDNPIFYVQYAHSRCYSIIAKAIDTFGADNIDITTLSDTKHLQKVVHNLQYNQHLDIVIKLAMYPRIMESVIKNYEPHLLAFYILDVATMFHALWNAGNDHKELRIVIAEDMNRTKANLALVLAVRNVIASVLDIFDIQALQHM